MNEERLNCSATVRVWSNQMYPMLILVLTLHGRAHTEIFPETAVLSRAYQHFQQLIFKFKKKSNANGCNLSNSGRF